MASVLPFFFLNCLNNCKQTNKIRIADFNMCEDELLLLQSLVLACQSHDYQALMELEGELWIYLNAEQKELLHKLIQVLTIQ